MKTQQTWIASLGLCAALGTFGASAAPGDEVVGAPDAQQFGGVSVINGGASFEEVDAIKRMASQHKLRVEISGRGGNFYVADNLRLMQRDTVLADIPNAGPWLLMDVPPGRYTLQGTFEGKQVSRDVTVPPAGTTVHWVIPSTIN